jgi:transketolase
MGYMKEGVKLVGISSGFAMGMFGNTHYAVEDIGAVRSIENLTILSPSDGLAAAKAADIAVQTDSPLYIRLTGSINTPIIYKSDQNFEIGKAIRLKDGEDIVIISTGVVTANALKAANALETEQGVSVGVIDMFTIKPIDRDILRETLGAKLVVTVEEHNVIGGLGSAVSECLSEYNDSPPILRIGTEGGYLSAGDYAYMIEHYGLDAESIANKTITQYRNSYK